MSARPDLRVHFSVTDERGDLVGEDHRPATRSEAYAYLGWVECEEPYCGSFDRQGSFGADEYVEYWCGDCTEGFISPETAGIQVKDK